MHPFLKGTPRGCLILHYFKIYVTEPQRIPHTVQWIWNSLLLGEKKQHSHPQEASHLASRHRNSCTKRTQQFKMEKSVSFRKQSLKFCCLKLVVLNNLLAVVYNFFLTLVILNYKGLQPYEIQNFLQTC